MKKKITLAFILISSFISAQIKGTVTDTNGNALPYVNIYIENTYIGTTTNENGKYELNVNTAKNVTLLFQYLGYKTQKHVLNITQNPFIYDVTLQEEDFQLNEETYIG